MRDLGKLQDAELSTRKAIEINQEYAEAYSSLGDILRDLGKLKEAEISLIKANQLNPKSAQIKLNLGILEYVNGNIDSSLQILELAHEIDPNEKSIKYLLAIFKGRKTKKYTNKTIENIIFSLFEVNSNWNPVTLNREVEEGLIRTLYTIKTKKATARDRYQSPIFGNTEGSNYDLFESNIPIIKSFKKDILNILSEYFQSKLYVTDAFFNIIRPTNGIGGGNKIHSHLSKIDKIPELGIYKQKLSLVYYLSIGDQDCEEPGILKLENPDLDILPTNGLIILFPSKRNHSVFYKGTKDRIIIGVNFYSI